jgi:hypothetical protein
MSEIRFLMDEDVYGAVAPTLRRAGFDALSTPEAGRGGQTDQSQLDWASKENRALFTFNVGHFANSHSMRRLRINSRQRLFEFDVHPVQSPQVVLANLVLDMSSARVQALGELHFPSMATFVDTELHREFP